MKLKKKSDLKTTIVDFLNIIPYEPSLSIAAQEIARSNLISLKEERDLNKVRTGFPFSRKILTHPKNILYGERGLDYLTYFSQTVGKTSREVIDADLSGRDDCKLLLIKNPIIQDFEDPTKIVKLHNMSTKDKCLGLFYCIYHNDDSVMDMLQTKM